MSKHEFVDLSVAHGIATITLDRPPLNILHNPMMARLNEALERVLADTDLAALVFRHRGKAFSAGVDIGDHTQENVRGMIELFHGIFRKLASTDALTVAVVNGAALGGGCELACFCDIVLASDRSKFGQPEVHVGVLPPVAACTLPLQVGIRKAVELTALGPSIRAAEAHRIGLINQMYRAERFEEQIEAYLDGIRKLSRPVVRLAKKATTLVAREQFLAHLERVERLYLDELMTLPDAHEGVAAFIQKRPPVWSHAQVSSQAQTSSHAQASNHARASDRGQGARP